MQNTLWSKLRVHYPIFPYMDGRGLFRLWMFMWLSATVYEVYAVGPRGRRGGFISTHSIPSLIFSNIVLSFGSWIIYWFINTKVMSTTHQYDNKNSHISSIIYYGLPSDFFYIYITKVYIYMCIYMYWN